VMRLGLAGLGVGSAHFLKAVDAFPQAQVVAAADLRASARTAFEQRYHGRAYEGVEALCADPAVDVVWVATPNHLHCEHAILAAEHQKHVICTKPMAVTVEDVLARRTRALFLNARAAIAMAPRVAELMARELGCDANWQARQVASFHATAKSYVLTSAP